MAANTGFHPLQLTLSILVSILTNTYVIVGILVGYLLWNKYAQGLNTIPGPFLAGFSNLWRLIDVWGGSAQWTVIRLHQELGPLVRTGPNHVSVSDPQAINTIYGVKPRFLKTDFYPSQSISWEKRPQANLFSTLDEKYHDEQKKKVGGAYSLGQLLKMEPAVDSCIRLFMSRLSALVDKGEPINLGEWLEFYAFDVIGEITFSKKMGFLEQGKDVDNMIGGIEGMLQYNARCGQVPGAHKFLLGNPLFPILLPSMETWNMVVVFTLKTMNARASIKRNEKLDVYQVEDLGNDMLSLWSNVARNDPLKMSTRDIIVHTSTNVFAGSGTTSIALRAMIYYLCRNPKTMAKLIQEIDEADCLGVLSYPISYKQSKDHIPYVEAVMKESMRIHPGIGLLLERYVPDGGAEICGQHIPAGTVVGVNAWVTHHDPIVFPNPDQFIPERWTDSCSEKKAEMERSFFAFGAGPRTCIGRNISFIEIQKVITQILRQFEVTLAEPEKEWDVSNIWMVQQKGLMCNLKRRCTKS